MSEIKVELTNTSEASPAKALLEEVAVHSQYHFPLERPIVPMADDQLALPSAVTFKFPSVWAILASGNKAFNVAWLFVQVSVDWSTAVRLLTAKWLSLPDVSAPKPELFWLVPDCLNSK